MELFEVLIKEVFLLYSIGVSRKLCFHTGCLVKEGATNASCRELLGQFGSFDISPKSIRSFSCYFFRSNLKDLAKHIDFQDDQSKVDRRRGPDYSVQRRLTEAAGSDCFAAIQLERVSHHCSLRRISDYSPFG